MTMATTAAKSARALRRGALAAAIVGGTAIVGAVHGGIPKAAACGTVNVGSQYIYTQNGYGNIDGQINLWHNTCRNTVWASLNNWVTYWMAAFGDMSGSLTMNSSQANYDFPERPCYSGDQFDADVRDNVGSQDAHITWIASC